MEDDGPERVKGRSLESGDVVVGGDVPVGREDVSDSEDGVGEPGHRDEGAAEEATAETDNVRDAVDSVAAFQKIRNQESKGSGAKCKDARTKN